MPYREIIETLPIPEDYKSALIDLGVWFSVVIVNVYDKNVVTVLWTILGIIFLIIRIVNHFFKTKRSYHEQKIAEIEHDNLKSGVIEKETIIYERKKQN